MSEDRDEKLHQLYVELESVEMAIVRALFRVTADKLRKRRAELLGQIKKREREK